jgi:HTH-type transcriptional regulator/antitoxin HipB
MKQILSLSRQLGPLLQSARKRAGLSQTALAQRLGISQSRISAMELDPGSISVNQLLALLAALDHEVLVQPRQGATAADPADAAATAAAADRAGSAPDW